MKFEKLDVKVAVYDNYSINVVYIYFTRIKAICRMILYIIWYAAIFAN